MCPAGEEQGSFKVTLEAYLDSYQKGNDGEINSRDGQRNVTKTAQPVAEACESAQKICGNVIIQSILTKDEMDRRTESLEETTRNIMMLLCFSGRENRKGTKGSVWRLG